MDRRGISDPLWKFIAIVVLVLVTAGLSSILTSEYASPATVTLTSSATMTLSITSTATVLSQLATTATATTTETATAYATTTATILAGPSQVRLNGTASVNGLTQGSAASISFQSAGSPTLTIQLSSGGAYQVILANRATYAVSISYSGVIGGLGGGSCSAGLLVLFATASNMTLSWKC